MLYIGNAFSLQMVQDWKVDITTVDIEEVQSAIDVHWDDHQFCIGHADLATVACKELNYGYKYQGDSANKLHFSDMYKRINVSLKRGEVLYVLQVTGGRLPEGCTELPEGVRLVWRKVTVL